MSASPPARGQVVDANEITVSVVLPTYNRAGYLPQALDSLVAQSRQPDEIIVVDDCSTDATSEVLARYVGRVHAIRNETNIGKPAALNRAISLASGSHIWIFDDDDVALPDALQAHVEYLRSHPDIDFSYSDKFVYEGDGDIWDRTAWHVSRLALFPSEEFLVRTMESMNTLMQGMLIPARCYGTVGLFDAATQRCEDLDMLLRLGRCFRAGNIGQPTFVYRDHAGVRGSASEQHAGRDRFAVLFRYRQAIFRKVWAEYPLRSYLPGYSDRDEPVGTLRARALLQRSCIMFRQGLVNEGSADLQQAMQNLPKPLPREKWLPMLLSKSVDLDTWELQDRRRLLRSIDRALQENRFPLFRYIARGVYWSLNRAVRHREWIHALQSFEALALCGWWFGIHSCLPAAAGQGHGGRLQ